MSWLRNILNAFKPKPIRPRVESKASQSPIRRWDSAQHDPRNAGRWARAHGQSINTDLSEDLNNLMARCAHEYANNPIFEGVVNTFKDDVVGFEGPNLQVISDDLAFNDEIERQWRRVFGTPDPSQPTLGGVESMKQWVHLLMVAGSYLNYYLQPTRESAVNFGWRTIHPRRLVTPADYVGDPNVAFGIRTDDNLTPIEYYIDRPRYQGPYAVTGVDYQTIPASMIQHRYIQTEPEQLTGYPMMAGVLNTAADIRELDRAEIKAQQRNAAHSLGLQAVSPELIVDPEPINDAAYPISEDQVNVAPAGWQWQTLDNNRPSSEHIDYRRERITEIGRPVGMPLLVILLTVSDVNFSSAQFGGMLYADAIKQIQSFIERLTLSPLAELVILETVLTQGIRRPDRYELTWTHNVPPNANFEKFANALRVLVEDGVISRGMATSWLGFDPEKVAASRQRDNELADEYDISRPPARSEGTGETPAIAEETEEENELANA